MKTEAESTTGSASGQQQPQSPSTFSLPSSDDALRTMAQVWTHFQTEISSTWQELLQSGERKDINKKLHVLHPVDTVAGNREYTGPVDVMIIDPSENLSTWERMQKRLTSAPIIQSILSKTEEIYETSGAKQVKQKIDHIREDAREACTSLGEYYIFMHTYIYISLYICEYLRLCSMLTLVLFSCFYLLLFGYISHCTIDRGDITKSMGVSGFECV
jgi:hypothetical protein